MSNKKTRDLSILEFLKALQIEYINAELRRKIYPKVKDKSFYKRTLERKKEKILDISNRNKLPNIFNDDQIKKDFYEMIYIEWGIPNFLYKDELHHTEFRRWDVINYFLPESEVRIKREGGEISVGTIVDSSDVSSTFFNGDGVIDENSVTIQVKERSQSNVEYILLKHISRIL